MRIRRYAAVAVLAWGLCGPALAFNSYIKMQNGYFYDPTAGAAWVPHGIAYQTWNRPLGVFQTHDQIQYDLDEMVKMGANSVRIDMVWQAIESQGDDIFDWANYDFFMQECEKRNIRVFALVGYQWPPNWFPNEWYTMHPPERDSEGIEHTNRWQSDIINYENVNARAQYSNWVFAVCDRYKTNKAVVAWIVGNEYGYLGLWSGLPDGYDTNCEAAFRTWTSGKYTNVAALNTAWGTSLTNFSDIKFVEQYRVYGPPGAQWADMVQWREDSIASFTALSAAASKHGDTNHLTSYSTVGMQWGEEDWRYHAEDRGKITAACAASGAPLDFFSVNNYPWSILGHESQNGQWGVSFTKKVTKIPVMYSETGFTSSETLWPGMDIFRQGQLVNNALWESLETGAIGTHIFSWMDRPYINSREKGFGILYADRRIKPSFWANRDTFTLMDQVTIQNMIAGSKDPKPDVAFLWTAANDSQYNRYECEMQQEAGALERVGYEPYFMNLDDLANRAYTNYSVLILPRNMRVEDIVPGTSMNVIDFIITNVIPAGVNVLASSDLPGMQNEHGQQVPHFEDKLSDLFGIDASDIGGNEGAARRGYFVFQYWKPIDVSFTTNAASPLSSSYTYRPYTWKYSDQIKVTDGILWATMNTRRNRGFEDSDSSPSNWSTWGGVAVQHNWGWQYDGSNMLQMWGDAGIFTDFDIVPYGRYSHSQYLRSNADDPLRGGRYAAVQLEFHDQSNNTMAVVNSTHLTGSTPTNSWVKYTADGIAPAGGGPQLSEMQPWFARRITRVSDAATNLLYNGTLAGGGAGPDSWANWNDSNHDPDTGTYLSGTNSWGFWYDGGIYQDVTGEIVPGQTLRVGGYLYTPSGDALRNGTKYGIVQVEFRTTNDTVISTQSASPTISSNSAKSVWIRSEGNFVIPAGAVKARVIVRCNDFSSGDGRFSADNLFAYNTTHQRNLVPNSSLTGTGDGPDGWQNWNTGSHDPDTGTYRSSGNSWGFWWDGGIYDEFTDCVISNDTLTFGGYLYTPSSDALRGGTKYGVVQLELYNGSTLTGTYSASPAINSSSPKSTWVYTEGSVVVPAGTTKARIVVRCNDYSSGDGRFSVDDVFVRNVSPGGSVYVDDKTVAPAVVVKGHGAGKGKTAIFLYAVGDNKPDGDGDGEMDTGPWKWRHDIFKSVVKGYFGVKPQREVTGTNDFLAIVDYRTLSDSSTLWQVKNYAWNTNLPSSFTNSGGGLPQTFTIQSDLFSNKAVQALVGSRMLTNRSDGTIQITLPPDGMEMLHVYSTNAIAQIVQIQDAPAAVHPRGSDSYLVKLNFDCLARTDLTINVAFEEAGDNGDGVSNEIYQLVSQKVVGSAETNIYVFIPNADLHANDYISTPEGGHYQFAAWLSNPASNQVALAKPQPTELLWPVKPTNSLPSSVNKGDTVNIGIKWEDLYEYLPWEATPLQRANAYPGRVAIFRSLKTEAAYPGHLARANAVANWLESMGYSSGDNLDLQFDNVTVPGLFSDSFSNGTFSSWTRVAGGANWTATNGALRASRIGNDDNIMVAGSAWTNYTLSADIKYVVQGPYFNDAEIIVRYQDRNNFVKVGIENFYGFWRLKRTVRVNKDNVLTTWLYDFPKTNQPATNVTYNLKIEATGSVFNVYFNNAYIATFVDSHFATGKIGVSTKATQLGIWEPQKGYYFIDDDEYSYYGGVDKSTTTGTPLNLDSGYLIGFYPTLILPGTRVMSDIEVSNILTWSRSGLYNLIVTDGGVAEKNEGGANDLGRIESLLGVGTSLNVLSNLNTLTVGSDGHYVTLDYTSGATVAVSGGADAYSAVTSGKALGTVGNGTATAPAIIVNTTTNDPLSPVKVVTFNFDVTDSGRLTNSLSLLAQRAFEWARGEAYKVTLELKFDTQTTNAQDVTLLKTTGWLLTESGTTTLHVNIPTNNIMTGDNLYWVMYVHPWDATDPWTQQGGAYSSEDESGSPIYTSISGMGLQILGITGVAYAGRDWDKWIAYNTRTQNVVISYGIKDKGLLNVEDSFSDGNYNGWNVASNPNIAWSVSNSALRATVSGTGGVSSITYNGLALNNTNITIEYDVFFGNGATQGGLVYRGQTLDINPTRCGWQDDTPNYTNTAIVTGIWQHVIVNIRDGVPYQKSDLRIGTNFVFANEPIETTNWTTNTFGFAAPQSAGYVAWDSVRLVDEEYALVAFNANGISYPSNNVPTGTWPTVPDYDQDMLEHNGTLGGSKYEWFLYARGQDGIVASSNVDVYFAPRLKVEATNFPVNMSRGDTVSLPIEWEDVGTNLPAKLAISLQDPYLGTNAGTVVYDITNRTGDTTFSYTVPTNAQPSPNYTWVAYLYPPFATNPLVQRLGLDDTFRFQPVTNGAPISPETRVTVNSIINGDTIVFADAGLPPNGNILTWPNDGCDTFDGHFTGYPPPEGTESFYALSFCEYLGWGIFDYSAGGANMSAYTNGYLKFSYWSFANLKVEVKDRSGHQQNVTVLSTSGSWVDKSISLTNFPAIDKAHIDSYFMITSFGAAEFMVDQVRWSNTP